MKDLTIRIKLIISFSLIALLVAILSIASIYQTEKSAEGFENFRTMSKNSQLAAQLQKNMLVTQSSVMAFLSKPNKDAVKNFNENFKDANNLIEDAAKVIIEPTQIKYITQLKKDAILYNKAFLKVVEYTDNLNKTVTQELRKNAEKIIKLLNSVVGSARNDGDYEIALEISLGMKGVLLANLHAEKFLISNLETDSKKIKKEFELLSRQLRRIAIIEQNEKRINQLEEVGEIIILFEKGVQTIKDITLNRTQHIDKTLNILGNKISKNAENIKTDIKKDQQTIEIEVESLNSEIKVVVMLISALILLIVVALNIIIPRRISNQINTFQHGLIDFFKYLNKQTTSAQLIPIKSKDEIGLMAQIVNENINKTKKLIEEDKDVINDVKRVASLVKDGYLKQEVGTSTENKGLNELKTVFNEMIKVISHNIAEDLNSVIKVLESYSNMDFTQRIENQEAKMVTGLNTLADIINEMLVNNANNGFILQQSSDTLLANVNTLNNNSNQAAASLEETAAAIEQITGTIRSSNETIKEMSIFVSEVSQSAQEGENLAIKTNEAMEEINVQVNEINNAIGVIDKISFQTNILSLNAAVEAATAGESGKGFAVVAQEVRNLANRSSEAANQIKNLVENANIKTSEGKKIADNMIHGYGSLKERILKTGELISDIEISANEQRSGMEQINDAINQLDQRTQNNVSIANEANEIAKQTASIARTIVQEANSKKFINEQQMEDTTKQESAKGDHASSELIKEEKKENVLQKQTSTKKKEIEHGPVHVIRPDKTQDDEWESF